jgi:hypothetical protein
MTNEMEIYYSDLLPEAQERFDELFGESEEFNHDSCPLFVYQQEDEDEFEKPDLFIAAIDKDEEVFSCPNISDFENIEYDGWEIVETYFVDSSGCGAKDEPAMNPEQFLMFVKQDYGYAITDKGRFQIYISEYQKIIA